jgi:hypothetical protein
MVTWLFMLNSTFVKFQHSFSAFQQHISALCNILIVSHIYSPDDAHKKEYRLRTAVLVSYLLFLPYELLIHCSYKMALNTFFLIKKGTQFSTKRFHPDLCKVCVRMLPILYSPCNKRTLKCLKMAIFISGIQPNLVSSPHTRFLTSCLVSSYNGACPNYEIICSILHSLSDNGIYGIQLNYHAFC